MLRETCSEHGSRVFVPFTFQHMERFEEIRCLVRGEVLSWLAERYP